MEQAECADGEQGAECHAVFAGEAAHPLLVGGLGCDVIAALLVVLHEVWVLLKNLFSALSFFFESSSHGLCKFFFMFGVSFCMTFEECVVKISQLAGREVAVRRNIDAVLDKHLRVVEDKVELVEVVWHHYEVKWTFKVVLLHSYPKLRYSFRQISQHITFKIKHMDHQEWDARDLRELILVEKAIDSTPKFMNDMIHICLHVIEAEWEIPVYWILLFFALFMTLH